MPPSNPPQQIGSRRLGWKIKFISVDFFSKITLRMSDTLTYFRIWKFQIIMQKISNLIISNFISRNEEFFSNILKFSIEILIFSRKFLSFHFFSILKFRSFAFLWYAIWQLCDILNRNCEFQNCEFPIVSFQKYGKNKIWHMVRNIVRFLTIS